MTKNVNNGAVMVKFAGKWRDLCEKIQKLSVSGAIYGKNDKNCQK